MSCSYNVFTRREGWRYVWTVVVEDEATSTLVAEYHGWAFTDACAYNKALDATRRHELAGR